MLEREEITATLVAVVEQIARGGGASAFVAGEAGLGKSALLDSARRSVEAVASVSCARGDAMESSVPFGLAGQALHGIGVELTPGYATDGRSPDVARGMLFYRTLQALEAATQEGPKALFLDDLHWADRDSLALLSFLCRRLSNLPVAVIATFRHWPPGADQLAAGLVKDGHATLTELAPLSEKAAQRLLASRLSSPPDEQMARRVARSCAGNPLLVERAALAMERGEALNELVPGRPGAPDLVVLSSFAGLPDAALALAHAACVLGARFRMRLAIALSRLDEEEADLAVDALSRSGIVRAAEPPFAEFAHPMLHQALYDDLPPLVRRRLHERACRVLAVQDLESEAAEHAIRAHLDNDPDAVALLERVGRAALAAGAVETALRHLDAAVGMAGANPAPSLLLAYGEGLLANGRAADARDVYLTLLGTTEVPASLRVEVLRMLGRAMFMAGYPVGAATRFEEAALAAGDNVEQQVRALLDQSRAAWLTGGPKAALPVATLARRRAQPVDSALRTEVEGAWVLVAFVAGDASALTSGTTVDEALAHANGDGRDLWWNWSALRNLGRTAKFAERFGEAELVFQTLSAAAERSGSPHPIVSLAAHHADILGRSGRVEEARALLQRTSALIDLAPMAEAFARAVEAWILLEQGRPAESEDACERAWRAGEAWSQWLPLLWVRHVRALRALREGRPADAAALYADLEAETERLGIGEPCVVPWARHAVDAYVAVGRPDDAERVLSWLAEATTRLPCRWPRIAGLAGRARLAEAAGDDDRADELWTAACSLHEQVALPLDRVETLLGWGAFLRRRGRPREARPVLADALSVAEGAGARWLADAAQRELAVAGGRRRQAHAGPDVLTPQEQRVADLATAGHAAREIADQLSVSIRTVETHLGRIYAKLGVRSQRELMARGERP